MPNTTPEKDKAATDAAWEKGFLCGVFAMIILSPIVKGVLTLIVIML
jgi:phosphate/sulfate permease